MFNEIDEISRNEQNNDSNFKKNFPIDGITNKQIGGKIKNFSKIFLKIQIALLILTCIVMGLALIAGMADVYDGEGFLILLISVIVGGLLMFLSFISMYFSFLIVSGLGSIIEDLNAIKTYLVRQNKNNKSEIDYDDLPKL